MIIFRCCVKNVIEQKEENKMIEFIGFTNYNPNKIYFNEEKKQYNSFPRYYICDSCNTAYKIDGVDSINPRTNSISYIGSMIYYGNNNTQIDEKCVFSLPDDKREINEKAFNRICGNVKEEIRDPQEYPKYFYHSGRSSYIKVIKEARVNGDSVYCCTVIEPRDARIEGQRQLSKFATDRDCIHITEKDYEKIFKEIINKI